MTVLGIILGIISVFGVNPFLVIFVVISDPISVPRGIESVPDVVIFDPILITLSPSNPIFSP